MTAIVHLRSKVPAKDAEALIGRMLTEQSFDALVTGDCDVFKPDGKRLASLIKNAIPQELYDGARDSLLHLKKYASDNRGTYAGLPRAMRNKQNVTVDPVTGKRASVPSSIIGFFERTPRFPFCRPTAFTQNEPERWATIVPLAQHVARVFEARAPDRFRAQAAEAAKTNPAFLIPGTPFTTMTVNNTVRGACHRDAGDLKAGFGCISALRIGHFDGSFLVFPEFRVAVDIGPNDLLLFDPHEMHGNTPMKCAVEGAERVSIVYYFRDGMQECGSPSEEQERAKQQRGALVQSKDPL